MSVFSKQPVDSSEATETPMTDTSTGAQSAAKPELIVYGTGAMAVVYASYFSSHFQIKAYCVEQTYCHRQTFAGLPLYPFESVSQFLNPSEHVLVVAVGYRDMNHVRARISDQAARMGFSLASFIAPDLWRHDGVEIHSHCVILDHCSIHANCTIGENTFISSGVNLGHDCNVGKNVWINSGVTLAGGVGVGNHCFLGINSSVAQGVKLAAGTYVGANTLVSNSTEENQVVVSAVGEVYPLDSRVFLAMMENQNAS